MVESPIAYHLIGEGQDAWFADAAAADAAVAGKLGVELASLESLRRRISINPVVVRQGGSRWRSRQVWSVRSGERLVRVYEMLKVDEAAYDH